MGQKILFKKILFFIFFVAFIGSLNAQTEIFKRLTVIAPRVADQEGYGNAIMGHNITGSGAPQIYAISGELYKSTIPRIYEFKFNGTSWDSVWSAVPNIPNQNTWAGLTYGDLDGDGKMEVIWGPVNALNATTNPNPPRILVYEAEGGGSDALGVADGNGGYKPNAEFTISDSITSSGKGLEIRPFRIVVADVNNDGKQEIIFADRKPTYRFGVISVSNIPDNGDSSETWKIDASGVGSTMSSSTIYDLAVIDSTIYLFHSNGTVTPVFYANGKYTIGPDQANVVPGGSWKSAQVVDLAGDGKKEIVVGQWSGGSQVYLLQQSADTLTTTVIGDFSVFGANRLNGGAVGDLDGNGHLDFVYGSRSGYGGPNGAIYRLAYQGGGITNPGNYKESIIDSLILANGGQYDIVATGNVDNNSSTDEVLYSGIPRGLTKNIPLVVLGMTKVNNLSSIAQARVDADTNFVPDNDGKTMTVIGVVNAPNLQGTKRFSYSIQDGNSGILLFNYSKVGPKLNFGDRVLVTGKVTQYKGTTELTVSDPNTDVTVLDSGRVLTPDRVTIESYLANAESYESRLIEIDGIDTTNNSSAWPSSGKTASLTMWDGYKTLTLRVDSDTDLDDNPAPTYPIDVIGVATQYTSSTPANNGYQITPGYYADITQGVAVPPSPYFFFSPIYHQYASQGPLVIKDSTEVDTVTWSPSVDLNGDQISYQLVGYSAGKEVLRITAENGAQDTVAYMKATDLLNALGGKDTANVDFVIFAQSPNNPIVSAVPSVDTLQVTLVNDIVTSVEDNNLVLRKFFVSQNYPNPFNPTTTIRFGLQKEASVDLRIYNILGQEVAVLIHNQVMKAGVYNVNFNASNLASGTYIYRLRSGNHVVSKKMMLLK